MGFKKKSSELQSLPPVGLTDMEIKNETPQQGKDKLDLRETDDCVDVERVELRRELGLFGGISYIVGVVIGSGIFVSPAGVLESTGSVGLCLTVWIGSGLIALLGGLCYAELGTMIPKSGGEYSYIQKAYGNAFAFLVSWTGIVVMRPSSLGVISLTFATYFTSIFDVCGTPLKLQKIVAITCLMTILLLNGYSTALSARTQIFTTIAKTIALFIIVIGGIVKLAQGGTTELEKGFSGSATDPSTISLSFYNALWAFDGWNNLNYAAEELRNPSKNLPRAIIVSCLTVMVIYVLTNISYLSVMTTSELLDADAVAVVWGDRVLKSASIIIPLAVMVSTFGSLNGVAFMSGRSLFVAARDENLPELFSLITVHQKTPLPSMVFSMALAIIFVLLGDISSLVNFFSFTAWLFYCATFMSLIIFRFTMKNAPRPYKVPILIPIIMVLVAVYLVIAPIVEEPAIEFLYAVLFVLGGLVLYIPFVHFKLKVPFIDEITLFIQLLFGAAPASKYMD